MIKLEKIIFDRLRFRLPKTSVILTTTKHDSIFNDTNENVFLKVEKRCMLYLIGSHISYMSPSVPHEHIF